MSRRAPWATLFTVALTAFAAGAMPQSAGQNRRLALRTGEVNTRQLANLLDAAAPRDSSPTQHLVVQIDGPITPARRQALSQAGVQLGEYLPDNAYVATLRRDSLDALRRIDFVEWVGEYRNDWKTDPQIGARLIPFQTPERIDLAARSLLKLNVILFSGEDLNAGMVDLAALGADVLDGHVLGGFGTIEIIAAPGLLGDLAALPSVQFIEEASEITLRNNSNRWIVQSNILNSTPLYDNGITGSGQIVGIIDGEINEQHCAFYDTNPIGPTHRKIEAYNAPFGYNYHGTHVAGTAVGDGGAFDNNRGVAYNGRLCYNTIPSFNETAIVNRLTLHHNQGARVHTNSWGDDGTTAYNSLARGFDVFSYNYEDSLVVLAETNLSTLRNPENAKDLLAVAASQDSPNQDSHCSGGIGPTADGRRKPEIYAPGCGTVSSTGDGMSCSTTSLTGTSMATPAVAGTAMLIRQYYTDGYYPSGTATPADAFIPSGALVKATLLNSAVDMTGIAGYPSNLEGWGRVLADNALYFPGDTRTQVVYDVRNADGLSTGQATLYTFSVTGGSEPLRVTMVFTDPPGAVNASDPVVNNLDLAVTAPDGITVYRGNYFSGGQSIAGGTADPKNNVEQVLRNTPATGTYEIEVSGTAVNQGTQGYALVVTGEVQLGPWPPETHDVVTGADVGNPISITLDGTDLDEDPLDFIVLTLPAYGGLSDPGAGDIASVPYTLAANGNEVLYTPNPIYVGTDGFLFKANDGTPPPDGGDSNTSGVYITMTNPPQMVYSYPLDTDPGWSTEGLWDYGTPTGGGTHNLDPTSGYSGSNVYGYNLFGDYPPDMATIDYLTMPAIDCSTLSNVELRFWRWLGVEAMPYDNAMIDVSTDGVVWTTAWDNGTTTLSDSGWTLATVDISSVADDAAAVYIRWGMGPTDHTVTYPGWNIDDVEIWAAVPVPPPPGDYNGDGWVNADDAASFAECINGPDNLPPLLAPATEAECLDAFDWDGDNDVDLVDFASFQQVFAN